jgi:RNA polymerase sigma-70 factor (ECF subfamily)
MDAVAPPMMDAAIGEPGVACTGAWDDASRWIEIFGEVAAGRTEPLGDLYDMASRRLYGLALWRTGSRDLAAEVVQELFIRVAEHGERLASVRDPRWWLLSVTHRLAIDAVRRAARREAEPIDEHAELAAEPVDHARAVDAQRAWALVARLSAKQREVIYLHHVAEMSHAEIGRCLGVPAFTAASRYRLALKALRGMLGRTT